MYKSFRTPSFIPFFQVGRLGQLEVSHWELSRGIEGAQAARSHLSAMCRELQAGRTSIALVLGQVGSGSTSKYV